MSITLIDFIRTHNQNIKLAGDLKQKLTSEYETKIKQLSQDYSYKSYDYRYEQKQEIIINDYENKLSLIDREYSIKNTYHQLNSAEKKELYRLFYKTNILSGASFNELNAMLESLDKAALLEANMMLGFNKYTQEIILKDSALDTKEKFDLLLSNLDSFSVTFIRPSNKVIIDNIPAVISKIPFEIKDENGKRITSSARGIKNKALLKFLDFVTRETELSSLQELEIVESLWNRKDFLVIFKSLIPYLKDFARYDVVCKFLLEHLPHIMLSDFLPEMVILLKNYQSDTKIVDEILSLFEVLKNDIYKNINLEDRKFLNNFLGNYIKSNDSKIAKDLFTFISKAQFSSDEYSLYLSNEEKSPVIPTRSKKVSFEIDSPKVPDVKTLQAVYSIKYNNLFLNEQELMQEVIKIGGIKLFNDLIELCKDKEVAEAIIAQSKIDGVEKVIKILAGKEKETLNLPSFDLIKMLSNLLFIENLGASKNSYFYPLGDKGDDIGGGGGGSIAIYSAKNKAGFSDNSNVESFILGNFTIVLGAEEEIFYDY